MIAHSPPDRQFGPPRYGTGPLVNSADLMLHFRITYGVRLADTTIRQWATRKRIGTYGRRRERYDIREVVAYAVRRGLISAQHSRPGSDGSPGGSIDTPAQGA